MTDAFVAALLRSQREQLRATLLILDHVSDRHRSLVRGGCMQALGAIEDALGEDRTFPRREERRRDRLYAHIAPPDS